MSAPHSPAVQNIRPGSGLPNMGTAFNQDISHSSYGEVSHHGALPLGNPQIQYDAHGQTHYDAHPQQQLQNQYDFHQPHQQQQHYTYAQMPQQQVHYQHQPPPQHYSAYQQAAIAGNEYSAHHDQPSHPSQIADMQNYGLYGMYPPSHTSVDTFSQHNAYMQQPDPRYLQPLSGMSAPPNPLVGAGVAPSRSVDGFGHALSIPPYMQQQEPAHDYSSPVSHRQASHHHALHHPYADNAISPGIARRKARNQMQPHTSQPIESHHHQLPPNQQQQQFYVDPNQPPHGHAIYGHHPNDGMYPPNAMPHPGLIQDHNGQSFVDPNSSQHLGVPVEFDPVTGAPLGPQSHQQQGHVRQLQKQVPPGANGSGNPDRSAAAAALVSSIVAVDNGKGSKVYKCPKPLCTKVYKNPNGLKYHLDRGACEVDHDVMEATTGISLHTDDPNTLFNLQLQAQQALQNGQDFPNSDGNPNAQSLTAALMASDESLKIVHRPYGCKIAGCDKRYQNLNGLKYHAKTAHPGLDFKTEVYVLFPF